MTDYAALKIEIAKPAYNGLTDEQIAAAINAATTTAAADITGSDARRELLFTANNDWGKLVGVADGWITAGVPAAIRLRAVQMRDLFLTDSQFATANSTRYTAFLAAVDQLITDTVMSAAGKTALVALARKTVSLAESMGWPSGIGPGDIAAARNWNG